MNEAIAVYVVSALCGTASLLASQQLSMRWRWRYVLSLAHLSMAFSAVAFVALVAIALGMVSHD